ncbi:MAG: isopenicillin N synthase family oxygenase [Chlamydiia bacterium]|nr:isopenicillin N synthase family oxygenase [Chlamydiia bacterium]
MQTDYSNMATMGTAPGPQESNQSLCLGDAEIPLFDLAEIMSKTGKERAKDVQALGDGLRDVGFVAIKAEEITGLIAKVTAQMEKYFDQSLEKKMEDDHHNHYQTGFWPPGMETAAGATQPDNKETYFIPPNYTRWPAFTSPEEQKAFQTVMEAYQKKLTTYATQSMQLVAEYLNEPGESVSTSVESAHNLIRLAHYFPSEENDNAPRAGAHYDLNCLTLLPPATGPGLQLMTKSGEWKAVNVQPGYLILNTGEQLEKKTGGVIKATLHRVVKDEGSSASRRLASIFFSSFSSDFSLKPFESCVLRMTENMTKQQVQEYRAQYPDVTVMENLMSRLIEMSSIPNPDEAMVKDLLAKGLLRQAPQTIRDQFPNLFNT